MIMVSKFYSIIIFFSMVCLAESAGLSKAAKNRYKKVKPVGSFCFSTKKPLVSADLKECGVEPFDIKFVDTDQETMFKLLLAANYMDVTDLLYLVCAKVASLMKGKTPEQIRKTFNIRTDSTPEEEEEIRREHKDLIG